MFRTMHEWVRCRVAVMQVTLSSCLSKKRRHLAYVLSYKHTIEIAPYHLIIKHAVLTASQYYTGLGSRLMWHKPPSQADLHYLKRQL